MPPIPRRLALAAALVLLVGCEASPSDERAPAPAEPEAVVPEGWQVNVAEAEAGEDEPGSVLLTRRAEPGSDPSGWRPRLVLGCDEGVTEAYVEWGTALGAGPVPVTVRRDDEAAEAMRWRVSDDGEAAGLWADSTAAPFLGTLLGRAHLTVQVTPADAAPLEGRFALAGFDSLMAQVQAVCPGG